MRVIIQRVKEASVTVKSETVSSINQGLLILLGIEADDDMSDIEWLCKKISKLRIFGDDQGLMNLSVQDVNGEIIVVSQFTLHASTKKGNRPSFIQAAKPEIALPVYEKFVKTLEILLKREVGTGVFGEEMDVALINDGPVTIMIDSKLRE